MSAPLPADLKHPSKLSGAWARRAVWRKVLEHVALGHGNRVVQHKSPPLVGFTSLPVASLLLPATAAASIDVNGSYVFVTTVWGITSTGL